MPAHPEVKLRELYAELAYTPARLRCAHLARLEKLIPELSPDGLYPYEYIFHRITLFKPDSNGAAVSRGSDLLRELGRTLRTLGRSTPCEISGAVGEEVVALPAAAAQCAVSPTTLWRWGVAGLPINYYAMPDGTRAWGVRRAALEKFLASRPGRSGRASKRFTQEEARSLLARARELDERGVAPAEIVRQLAEGTEHSAGSVRRLLRRGRTAPAEADEARRSESEVIVQLYRTGMPVQAIAQRFNRKPATIYRALHRALMEKVLALQVNYVPNPAFAAPDAEQTCLGEEGLFTYPPEPTADMLTPSDAVPPYLAELYRIPLLSREAEKHLFRKYNYIKYLQAMLQEKIRRSGYRAGMLERFDQLREAASQVQRILIRCNLRLVVSIDKRHAGPLAGLPDLISEGNMRLIRAVECYDCAREARFATYATWAVTKHFARLIPEQNYRLSAFQTGQQARLNALGDAREADRERSEFMEHVQVILGRAVQALTERERTIVESHYGTRGRPVKTLEELGQLFGLTRERIRQIEAHALAKLRDTISPDVMEGVT